MADYDRSYNGPGTLYGLVVRLNPSQTTLHVFTAKRRLDDMVETLTRMGLLHVEMTKGSLEIKTFATWTDKGMLSVTFEGDTRT